MKDGRINNAAQICSARIMYSEWGERFIIAENGCLTFTVSADRAMDIYSLRHRGTNISFLSKNGLSGYKNDFDSAFEGGFLYTCGPDTVGGRALPVHGKFHSIPAHMLEVTATESGIVIRGEVRYGRLFKENLVLYRTIKTDCGSGTLTIENELVNEGFTDAGYCLLFHTNFGYPFLDGGVKIKADAINTRPRTQYAAEGLNGCFIMEAPEAGREEQVYYHQVKTGNIRVENEKISKRVTINYDEKAMPYFIEWKSAASGDYALGIEPSTTTLDGEFNKNILKAGERKSFPLLIQIEDTGLKK